MGEVTKKSFRDRMMESTPAGPIELKVIEFFRYMMLLICLLMLSIASNLLFQGLIILNNHGLFEGMKSVLVNAFTEQQHPDSPENPVVLYILFLGCTLYALKRKQQFYYGVLETLFALANCHAVSDFIRSGLLKEPNTSYVLLATGMTTLYLLVRGLSNIREGYDKPFYLKSKVWFIDFLALNYLDFRRKYGIEIRD